MIPRWELSRPVLSPGAPGTFDETAVKDPSLVYFDGRWHVFYTARGRGEYTTGYVAAPTLEALGFAPRHELTTVRGKTRYGCAPQVFFFRPQGLWYLIFQTTDAFYQPAFVTTRALADPQSWSAAQPLLAKETSAKWIDFWVLCDDTTAYLYYAEDHDAVMVRRTLLVDFPRGWGEAQAVFHGVHEAVHVYKARDAATYDMIYERNTGVRSFGLARAAHPLGPWQRVTEEYASGAQLRGQSWTRMVSHGEALRTGYDERLEYDAARPAWLIQELLETQYTGAYPEMPWRLGVIHAEERIPF